MTAVLAYHADDNVWQVTLAVGIPLAAAVVVILALLARLPTGTRPPNWPARAALLLTLPTVPLAFTAPLGLVLSPLAVLPLAAGVLATLGATRIARNGEKAVALSALAGAALGVAWVVATVVACVATDTCLH